MWDPIEGRIDFAMFTTTRPSASDLTIMPSNNPQAQSAPDFVGTWHLVSCEARDSKGQLQYPMGERVSGQLVYDSAGNMSAHVMTNDRPLFASNDPVRGTDAEVRAAFEGYTSYFGTYTIDAKKQTVTHHVRGASYPNWVATDQLRYYKLEGTRLSLSAPIVVGGQTFEFVLNWQRIQ
jgi:hypothetical protein